MAPVLRSRNRKRKAEDDSDDDRPSSLLDLESAPLDSKAKIAKIAGVDLGSNTVSLLEPAKTLHNIKDWFDRRNNAKTKEADLYAILTDVSRLVARCNTRQLSQMVQAQDRSSRLELAGRSMVRLSKPRNRPTATCIGTYPWIDTLSREMARFSNCGSKTLDDKSKAFEVEFFGLVVNAITAGFAFQLCFNLIMKWSKNAPAAAKRDQCDTSVAKLKEFVNKTSDVKVATSEDDNVSKHTSNGRFTLCGWSSIAELETFRRHAGEIATACLGYDFEPLGSEPRKRSKTDGRTLASSKREKSQIGPEDQFFQGQ